MNLTVQHRRIKTNRSRGGGRKYYKTKAEEIFASREER